MGHSHEKPKGTPPMPPPQPMVNSPLIRPAIYWGGSFGGVPLDSHDISFFSSISPCLVDTIAVGKIIKDVENLLDDSDDLHESQFNVFLFEPFWGDDTVDGRNPAAVDMWCRISSINRIKTNLLEQRSKTQAFFEQIRETPHINLIGSMGLVTGYPQNFSSGKPTQGLRFQVRSFRV